VTGLLNVYFKATFIVAWVEVLY